MATITIPDDVKAIAETRAAEAGYASADEYVAALVRGETVGANDYGAPEHLTVQTHEQLVALVREGLASPAREMTPEDWDRMREELVARHGKPKAE